MSSSDLFNLALPDSRLHPQFRALRESMYHQHARGLMNALFGLMGDPNGNFVRDFQGDGFHSRVFELACFAYLTEARFSVDRSHQVPDFLAASGGIEIALEAVTANPPTGRATDISVLRLGDLSCNALLEKATNETPRRIRSILRKKLAHRYDELPQCAGKPLILMVAPFFEPGSVFFPDECLVECLYGASDDVDARGKPTPFFRLPHAEAISAVLYCNAFTVPRFFRLATPLAEIPGLVAIRSGMCLYDVDAETFAGCEFSYRVGDPSGRAECWSEGVTLFLNPLARRPVDRTVLPCTSTFAIADDALFRNIYGFHPVTSSMVVHVPDAPG